MAGTSKPNVEKLGKEMTDYTINEFRSNNAVYAGCHPKYLFDGIEKTSVWWQSFDWNYSSDYCTITFNKKCNIWRKGDSSQLNPLNISPNTFKTQHPLRGDTSEYQLWLEGVEPGTYTFSHKSGYRGDVEWYLEEVQSESQLIKNIVKNAIINHELIKNHLLTQDKEE
jgi:hypothetical protein